MVLLKHITNFKVPGNKFDINSLLKNKVTPEWNVPHHAQVKLHNWLLNKSSDIKIQNKIMEILEKLEGTYGSQPVEKNILELARKYYSPKGSSDRHFLRSM